MPEVKREPEAYQPPDCKLITIAIFAAASKLSSARVYQMFQEHKLTIVTVSGKQFVKLPKPVTT